MGSTSRPPYIRTQHTQTLCIFAGTSTQRCRVFIVIYAPHDRSAVAPNMPPIGCVACIHNCLRSFQLCIPIKSINSRVQLCSSGWLMDVTHRSSRGSPNRRRTFCILASQLWGGGEPHDKASKKGHKHPLRTQTALRFQLISAPSIGRPFWWCGGSARNGAKRVKSHFEYREGEMCRGETRHTKLSN